MALYSLIVLKLLTHSGHWAVMIKRHHSVCVCDVWWTLFISCWHCYVVPSQVIVSRTLQKKNMSIATKIVLQMTCKMGGELWAVHIPVTVCHNDISANDDNVYSKKERKKCFNSAWHTHTVTWSKIHGTRMIEYIPRIEKKWYIAVLQTRRNANVRMRVVHTMNADAAHASRLIQLTWAVSATTDCPHRHHLLLLLSPW